jgi:DnaJ-class molecular chaperone
MEVKARYKTLARTYHPDVHRSEVTGLTPEGATQHMQLINSSYEYLREYFERGRTKRERDDREREREEDIWTSLMSK